VVSWVSVARVALRLLRSHSDQKDTAQPYAIRQQRQEWNALSSVQQWLLDEVLGVDPRAEEMSAVTVVPRRSRAQKWEANLAAARWYRAREGHLTVPRTHTETVDGSELALGVFIASSRTRNASLAPERIEELSTLGVRW